MLARQLDSIFRKEKKIFWLDDENLDVVESIFDYLFRDKVFEKQNEWNLNKGLLIIGNVGSGKTCLMDTISSQLEGVSAFKACACNELAQEYASKQFNRINNLKTRYNTNGVLNNVYFDDIGDENPAYGFEVMDHIISFRNKIWLKYGIMSHFSTNLSIAQIEERYGERTKSRLLQMSNVILLGKIADSLDRRIQWMQ